MCLAQTKPLSVYFAHTRTDVTHGVRCMQSSGGGYTQMMTIVVELKQRSEGVVDGGVGRQRQLSGGVHDDEDIICIACVHAAFSAFRRMCWFGEGCLYAREGGGDQSLITCQIPRMARPHDY